MLEPSGTDIEWHLAIIGCNFAGWGETKFDSKWIFPSLQPSQRLYYLLSFLISLIQVYYRGGALLEVRSHSIIGAVNLIEMQQPVI